jgi:DNA-binding SARP family transcriptional activator
MDFTFRLLGPVEVLRAGREVALGPRKCRAMLVALALQANQAVSLPALVRAVWAGRSPASAVANLRSYAAVLRQAIGDRLQTRPQGYLLRIDEDELDINEFRRLAAAGRQSLIAGDTLTASMHLLAALMLWRGPAGDDLGAGTTSDAHLAALNQQRLDVFEDYVDAAIDQGISAQLTAQIGEHLAHEPLRERAWGQLMLLHYRSGDIESALTTYGDARKALRRHLGVGPGSALSDLHQAILRRDPKLDMPSGTAIRSATSSLYRSDPIPPSLRDFAAEAELSDADIRMLSGIRVRGQAPRTPERWRYIYNAIWFSEDIDKVAHLPAPQPPVQRRRVRRASNSTRRQAI